MKVTAASMKPLVLFVAAAGALLVLALPSVGRADDTPVGAALRVGSTGIGLDVDLALTPYFGIRAGYSGFQYDRDVNSTDAEYHGRLNLSMPMAAIDWYVFGGGFRVSLGATGNGTKVDVTGKPAAGGTYTINNTTYTAAQVGSISGRVKFGNSIAPSISLGWGNPVGAGHWHFLFDIGAIYGGTPQAVLTANCGTADPPGSATCTQLQTNVQAEQAKLQSNADLIKWYPVVQLGVGYHF